jgi:hypothetical protein
MMTPDRPHSPLPMCRSFRTIVACLGRRNHDCNEWKTIFRYRMSRTKSKCGHKKFECYRSPRLAHQFDAAIGLRRPSRFLEAGFESMKMGVFLLFGRTKRPDLHPDQLTRVFRRFPLAARCSIEPTLGAHLPCSRQLNMRSCTSEAKLFQARAGKSRPIRGECHRAEVLGKRGQQLLRHPAGPQAPAAQSAIGDLDNWADGYSCLRVRCVSVWYQPASMMRIVLPLGSSER